MNVTTHPADDDAEISEAPKPKRLIGLGRREWTAIAVLLLLALALRFNFRQGAVQGSSMEPTFHDHDVVLVWKLVPRSSLKPRDVIIFRDRNGDELIKRIAIIKPWSPEVPQGNWALPNGGREVPFSMLFRDYFLSVKLHPKLKPAAERTIYVLGDNLPISDDSRTIGPISPDQILGKVIY